MDFAQRLVALSYESLGYFVLEGLSVGVREADLLAVCFNKDGTVMERLHVEVQVSATPKGVIRGKAPIGKSSEFPRESADEYIKKKYEHPKVVDVISSLLGSNYRRVFIYGRLKNKSQLSVFEENNIECIPIGKLVSNAIEAKYPVHELKRHVQVADLLKIIEP